MAEQVEKTQQSHFVLVHGSCHGAWCWYKLKPLLESDGHRVAVLDLVGSGINPKPIQAAPLFCEYTEPLLHLLASLPHGEKVILVGHSFGGLNVALAMENFPHKISCAVFLTAFMPDTVHLSSFVLEKDLELAFTLLRPSSLYVHDLSKIRLFTDANYGSVRRVYVECDQDKVIPLQFQKWMISNYPPHAVMEIKGSDHMAMFSEPEQLCLRLSEIARKYA